MVTARVSVLSFQCSARASNSSITQWAPLKACQRPAREQLAQSHLTKQQSKNQRHRAFLPLSRQCRRPLTVRASEEGGTSGAGAGAGGGRQKLKKGDAVVVVEEPPFVKTAEPMPMLRRNEGVIQIGDVGRVLDARPKDVWAVRLATGAFLLDGKYIQLME